MASNPHSSRHLIGNRVATAKSKTEKIQQDIELAEAELHLANRVITKKLAASASDGDLAKAATHNEVVEDKLRDAGDELKVVTELLKSEERDRERLEQAIEELQDGSGLALAGSRSGAGSASVIEHLRELTRHQISADAPLAGPGVAAASAARVNKRAASKPAPKSAP